jgi:hypothetical protein
MKDTFQHLTEWAAMINHIGPFDSFIEIGTYKGGTFSDLASRCQGKKISIDLCSGPFGGIGKIKAAERNVRLKKIYPNAHFIEGDSKKIETVMRLNDLLKGEKVDFLFIDADHSYKGVLCDYMIYRQFVKQNGFIAFHDIVDSEFHRKAGCYVSKLWSKLSGVSFIAPDNSDASPDAVAMGDKIWGGIGVIKNDFKEQVHLFQVIHNQESIDLCTANVGDYIPELILNTDNVNLENNVIARVYNEYKFRPTDFVGVTSPLVTVKTGLTVDAIVSACTKDIDVVNYWNDAICSLQMWDVNRRCSSNLNVAANELNRAEILPVDIFKKPWHVLYANFWMARNTIFGKYCKNYLLPAIGFFTGTKWAVWGNPKTGLLHRKKYYPISVFVIEGLFGTFIANNKFRVKKLNNNLVK